MRIHFHLTDQWVTSLDEIAKSRETTRSAVIRTAIETHVLSNHLDHFRKLQLWASLTTNCKIPPEVYHWFSAAISHGASARECYDLYQQASEHMRYYDAYLGFLDDATDLSPKGKNVSYDEWVEYATGKVGNGGRWPSEWFIDDGSKVEEKAS